MSLTSNWTFRLLDNGAILNDDAVPGQPFIDIDKVSGLDNAPFRESKRDHEGVDGGFIDAEFETGRDITLSGTVYSNGTPLEPFLDTLKANYAPVSDPVPFYLFDDDTGERVIFVKSRGCRYDWELSRRIGLTPIQFLLYAEDPRIYENFVQTIPFAIGATFTTGMSFNLVFNLSFGGSSTTLDGQFVTNAGNRPAPAIVTFTGPLDTPVLINDTSGDVLQFNIILDVGDTLVVDLANHTVKLNGNTNRRNTLVAPNWFLLPVGQTFLRFRAASGSGSMILTFKNAYR